MGDAPGFDGTYYNNFKEIWNRGCGLILPDLPDEVATAFAIGVPAGMFSHKALIDAFAVAPGEKLLEWWRTRPTFSVANKPGLTAHAETRAIGYGVFVAAYAGLLIGTAIVAAYETYGSRAYELVRGLAREVERATGRSFATALESLLLNANFRGANFNKAMHLGRALSAHNLSHRSQRRPAGGW